MADNVQDIVVSENYGRAKRATLLYGAALIVLSLATPSDHSVSVLGAAVPLDAAKLLTWLATLYYAINFGLEWRIARLMNSKAMANEYGGGVIKRFAALDETFKRYDDAVKSSAAGYVAALKGLVGNAEQILKSSSASVASAPSGFFSTPTDTTALLSKLDEMNKHRVENFITTIRTDQAIVEQTAQQNQTTYESVQIALTQLAADFHTLAGRFNTEQRFIFYVLDLGAVAVIFLAGTGVALFAALGLITSCGLI